MQGLGLTERQLTLLRYIYAYSKARGVSPSYGIMQDEMGLASKSGIHRLIIGLESRGAIVRRANIARSVRLTGYGESLVNPKALPQPAPIGCCVEIPLRGKIGDNYRDWMEKWHANKAANF